MLLEQHLKGCEYQDDAVVFIFEVRTEGDPTAFQSPSLALSLSAVSMTLAQYFSLTASCHDEEARRIIRRKRALDLLKYSRGKAKRVCFQRL